jgi:hypothetical protein
MRTLCYLLIRVSLICPSAVLSAVLRGQVQPYMRALCYELPDAPLAPGELSDLQGRVTRLESVMRDVQLLAYKFR